MRYSLHKFSEMFLLEFLNHWLGSWRTYLRWLFAETRRK